MHLTDILTPLQPQILFSQDAGDLSYAPSNTIIDQGAGGGI